MGATGSRENPDLIQKLLREPYRFEFFQAVRMLQSLGGRHANGEAAPAPERPTKPVGHDYSPEDEAVRFRAFQSLGFPASSVVEVQSRKSPDADRSGGPLQTGGNALLSGLEMTVSFMGLTGPSGVLPVHYTKLIIERLRDKDASLRDFFDLFNHRVISLFYRAWEKYRLPIAYERARQEALASSHLKRLADKHVSFQDPFTRLLLALCGLGTAGLQARTTIPDDAFVQFSGLLSSRRRSAVGLQQMLNSYFELPITVLQFQGQWLNLDKSDCTRLPSREGGRGSPNNALGISTVMGSRVWDVQSRFRIQLGPLRYEQYLEFTPAGRGFKAMADLVMIYVGPEFDFDTQPVLIGSEIPACRLGGAPSKTSARLGWTTWLKSQPYRGDFSGAVFGSESRSNVEQN